MPPTFFTTADKRKADSDIWAQQARSRLADAWEQNARLRLPDLIGEAQQKINQVLQPDLANASAAPTLPAAPAPVASPTPQTQVPPLPASGAGGDYADTIRQAAQRYGVDPETALRVAQSEGGTGSGASGDSGSSFGPFQLHYGNVAGGGNAVAGLGDEFTRQTGLDARDPANTTAAIDFALKHASQQGWGAFHGAARVGVGDQQGIGGQQTTAVGQPQAPASRTSQFNMGLDAGDAYSFCGPAAAIAFANSYGRFPTVDEAKQLAQKYGWTPQAGMAGIQSEQKLLTEGLGIPTKLEQQVDWQHVAQDAGSGNPVIISTPGHYFYVTGFDASSGRYNVNTSGTDLKGGSSWMTPDEMQQRMGSAQGALYADNPQSPGDSIAKGIGDAFSGLGSAAKGIGDALSNPGRIKGAAGEALSGFQAQARNANQPSAQPPPGTLGTPNTAPTPTAQSMLSGAKDFLTEEQPWMRNVVYGTQKQASADLGISPLEPGTQQPTQAERYATARGMATGLAQSLVPEDLIARAATTGAGSLAKSAEIGKDVARSKMPAEAEAGFAMGMPKPPGETTRMFHGTGADFARPEPGKFDSNGLFGPGYYLTDDSRVAGGLAGETGTATSAGGYAQARVQVADSGIQSSLEAAQRSLAQYQDALSKADPRSTYRVNLQENIDRTQARIADLQSQLPTAGPNVRAVDVPRDLRLLEADGAIPGMVWRNVLKANGEARAAANAPLEIPVTYDQMVTRLGGDTNAKKMVTKGLAAAGYDGIRYGGGQRVPMADAAGNAIEHTAMVVFPESLDKLRNAISGTQGGLAATGYAARLGATAAGGAAGYASTPEGASPQERALRTAAGAVGGFALGHHFTSVGRKESGGGRPFAMLPGSVAKAEPHGLTINLPKYTPPEVREVIQQAYDAHPEIMDSARRGVIPDEVVKDLAAQVGTNAQRISNLWKPGQAKNAETILALRQALADESQSVVAAQQRVKAAPTDLGAQQALIQALTRHASIQETVTGVTAEAGRALRQFRQPVEGTQATLQGLQRLAKQWKVTPEELSGAIAKADLSDPVAVAGLARNLVKHTATDRISALWYFGLLSSPLSHIRNVVSNSVVAVSTPLEVIPAATIDIARSAVTGKARERFYGEAGARVVGMGAGLREGVVNGLQVLAHGFTDEAAAGQLAGSGAAREAFSGKMGWVNAPGRALGAEDAFFRSVNKTGSLYAQAYRTASQEGLKGPALIDRVTELRRSPTVEMLKEAETEGAFRVFQSPSKLAEGISSITNQYPALKVVLPFVRTPINIAKFAMQYSPVGLGTLGYDALKGAAGSAGMVEDRLGRVAIGTAVATGLYLWAQDGNLTAAAPDSTGERDAFLRQHPAYSMRIGDQWYSYQALQPFSSLFAAVASIHDAQKRGIKLSDTAAATTLAFAIGKSITDMPWLQGLTNALEAQHDPQKMGGAYAESLARSAAFPTAFWGWVNRATDNMLRDPQDVGQAFRSQFPTQTDAAPPRQNAFGQDVKRPEQQMGLGALNPFNPAPDKTGDPVEKALGDLQMTGYAVEPGFVGDKMMVTGIPTQVTLTDAEQRQVQRVGGQLAYGVLLSLVTSPGWDQAPPMQRAKAINDVVTKTREYARTQLMPQVAPRAVEALRSELSTGVRKPAPKP